MNVLIPDSTLIFPFEWVNLTPYPESKGYRNEIYLRTEENVMQELVNLTYNLFGNILDGMGVYNSLWWYFCLDTWNIHEDEYDFENNELNIERQCYLAVLRDSKIEQDYSGCCRCVEWDVFLPVILDCVITHLAPYSPLFFSEKHDFFFYFHHTGSIGFYYRERTDCIFNILSIADKHYDLVIYDYDFS